MRDQFLLDPDVVFLNHGSFGACPRLVFERYQAWQLELERQPVEFMGRRYNELLAEARTALGRFVGSAPDNLIFVPNATAGLNTVARSLNLRAGDEILMSDHEYGALNLMWDYIARETGAELVVQKLPLPVQDEADLVEAIWRGVSPRTRVLFLSHITSPTALILPVEELIRRARTRGIFTMIDGAHVPGQLPLTLDELGVDFYSGNCHKWLCAPKGSAFVYISPERHALIEPLIISWGWDKETLPERTRWQGTRDISAYLSVPAAIQFQQDNDWSTVQKRCHDLAIDVMLRACAIVGEAPLAMPRFFGQMVAIPLPHATDATQLKHYLYEEHRIETPITHHEGRLYLRVSIQGYNTASDAQILCDALTAFYQPTMANEGDGQ